MGAHVHCPSCGAPAIGYFCEYCGTPLFTPGDALADSRGKRCHVWFENTDGTIECFDVFVQELDHRQEYVTLYADAEPYTDIATDHYVDIHGLIQVPVMADWMKLVEWQAYRLEGGIEQ